MKASNQIQTGFAEVHFTPKTGLALLGQMHERIAEYARDPLAASAMAVRKGTETVVMVSADILLFTQTFVEETQYIFSRRHRMEGTRLLLSATHTHDAPALLTTVSARTDPLFVKSLQKAVLHAASLALSRLNVSEVFCGTGYMDQMGWNRRAMFRDGTSKMFGHSKMPGFIGLEGPRDPHLPVLFARDARGKATGVILNFATHPNSLHLAHYYSADIPGEVRKVLKALLGHDVVVVYLTGASGNTSPIVLDPHEPEQFWSEEEGVKRSGLYMGGEAAKVIASTIHPMKSPVLKLTQTTLQIPMRSWPMNRHDPTHPCDWGWDPKHGRPFFEQARRDWPCYLATGNPVPTRLSVLRIGDCAICMNPGELFVEFGLQIRKNSPARVTMINQLTDGYVGYIPTRKAFGRGGYETWPAPTSKLVPAAGDKVVRATCKLLSKCFSC